jgi:peptide deformylase
MPLPIIQYGNPILRQQCRPVELVDESILTLVAEMLETMVDAHHVAFGQIRVLARHLWGETAPW